MDKFLANPGHHTIVRHLSSFLDANSLAQCRLVCKPFKEIIDSDRQWLIVQVEHIHQKEERIPRIHARISIESLFPLWTSFIRKLSKNAILPILSEVDEVTTQS